MQTAEVVTRPILDAVLTRDQLSQELGVSVRTVDRWAELNIGPPRVVIGNTVRYRVAAVTRWLDDHEGAAPEVATT